MSAVKPHPRKSVRDIFLDALAFKRRGLSPAQTADILVEIGVDNGYRAAKAAGEDTAIEVTFGGAGVIYLDDGNWHYRETAS